MWTEVPRLLWFMQYKRINVTEEPQENKESKGSKTIWSTKYIICKGKITQSINGKYLLLITKK